ncbi:hypothetical protein EB155_09385, partial [archaeon]|nr:hypothetical protein [archaeon]
AEGSDGVSRKRYSIFNRPFNTTNVGYWHGVVTYSGATTGAAIENTQFYIEGGLVEGSGSGAIGTIANSYSSIVISQYLISASMLTIGLFYLINFSYIRVMKYLGVILCLLIVAIPKKEWLFY